MGAVMAGDHRQAEGGETDRQQLERTSVDEFAFETLHGNSPDWIAGRQPRHMERPWVQEEFYGLITDRRSQLLSILLIDKETTWPSPATM
jgi:hypothetical protein